MAAFASDRRSGWVRFLVVLLCALFIFSTLGAPVAKAEALTVGLFTAAAVLSAATAALGFKLANSADGQATLTKMVQDFKFSATAVGLVLVGSKINGLIDGVDYIKLQVKAGKTYLDERVVAWVQQWLSNEGVYSTGTVTYPDYQVGQTFDLDNLQLKSFNDCIGLLSTFVDVSGLLAIVNHYNLDLSGKLYDLRANTYNGLYQIYVVNPATKIDIFDGGVVHIDKEDYYFINGYMNKENEGVMYTYTSGSKNFREMVAGSYNITTAYVLTARHTDTYAEISNLSGFSLKSNTTGLSSTDTLGKDVVDLTLDQVLQQLKEWAPDWWDAGADSSTNGAAAGAKDLPLNMGSDVKTVTGNPALEVDQPLIYTPWFDQTLDNLRNGETAGTVTNTATSAAETADKAEAAQGTVEDAQDVVQSIISWGLDYISPDKGLFSRFPLCIPYDAYLLVTAALGVDAQDLGDIVGQSPGDLSAQIDDGVAVQSDFVPVLSVKHDWTQDGVTTPVEVTIDLRPYDAIIKMIRTLVSVYVIAELIASEYKRIRGS